MGRDLPGIVSWAVSSFERRLHQCSVHKSLSMKSIFLCFSKFTLKL